jgi:hypothetical protein
MKDFGIVTLISVAAMAAAPAPQASGPAAFATARSTEQFAACFERTQDSLSRPWWFVAKDNGGGTISNLGAASVRNPYFLLISDRGSRREIQLQNASPNGPEAQGVDQCI